jgi:hypothetical protein
LLKIPLQESGGYLVQTHLLKILNKIKINHRNQIFKYSKGGRGQEGQQHKMFVIRTAMLSGLQDEEYVGVLKRHVSMKIYQEIISVFSYSWYRSNFVFYGSAFPQRIF